MKHILYVHHGKGIGGAPLSLLYLIRSLDRERVTPTVLCIHESPAADLFRKEGVETIVDERYRDFSHTNVLWYPWWQLPKILLRLLHIPMDMRRFKTFLAARSFDLVHLNTSTLLAFGIAAKRAGVPVVWHVREPVSNGYFGCRRALVRRVLHQNADAMIPICHYDASRLIRTDRIHVVYNFIDFGHFDARIDGAPAREELGIPAERSIVLFLGGVNRIKGTLEFARAARSILRNRDDRCVLIAGPQPDPTWRNRLNGSRYYQRRVMKIVATMPSSGIQFLGVRADVPRLIAASTLVCFPSTVPHFARPIIEASAMGKPVVASDIGGPQELVLHGRTGLLVAPGDIEALASAMESLLDDPVRAREMGSEGQRLAQDRFDASKNSEQIMRIYDALLHDSS